MDRSSVIRRSAQAAATSVAPALRATRFLVAVMVPVSLAVALLKEAGFIDLLSLWLDPAMSFIGLGGSSSLVFVSALLLNNYSAIAVIGTLGLPLRDVTILAVMCLIAHNLIIECAVMKRTGSSATKMALLRIFVALVAAFGLNLVLPGAPAHRAVGFVPSAELFDLSGLGFPLSRLPAVLGAWALASGLLIAKVAVLVSVLTAGQKILEEFGAIDRLGRAMAPLMLVFGLPASTSFLWIVANVLGLAYGSAIMIDRAESGKLPLADGDLFNHHAGISHSLLEDSILYMALGVGAFWVFVPRLVLAIAVVWLERGRRVLFRRSFRVGTVRG